MYRGIRRLVIALGLMGLLFVTWPFGPLFLLAWSFVYRHRVVVDRLADQAEERARLASPERGDGATAAADAVIQ